MIQTVTITVKEQKNSTTPLEGKYTHPKKGKLNLLMDGTIISRDSEKGENTKMINFDERNRFFTITYDDKTDARLMNEVNFWKNHPQVECLDNDYCIKPMFVMVDKTVEIRASIKLIKEKGAVYNLVNNAKVKDMLDIAFFVGGNPIKKSTGEIFLSLIDFNTGTLMQKPGNFLRDYKTPDVAYTIIAKKAVIFGIFEKREMHYYFDNELVGGEFDDVLAYCKTNEKMFDFIKKEVAAKDTLPIGVNEDETVGEAVDDKLGEAKKQNEILDPNWVPPGSEDKEPVITPSPDPSADTDLIALREMAKKLKMPMYHVCGKAKLIEKIEALKAKNVNILTEEEIIEFDIMAKKVPA